jgi:hypothetical protein
VHHSPGPRLEVSARYCVNVSESASTTASLYGLADRVLMAWTPPLGNGIKCARVEVSPDYSNKQGRPNEHYDDWA